MKTITTPLDERLAMLVDRLAVRTLTQCELALELRAISSAFQRTPAELGTAIGIGSERATALVRAVRSLHPDVLRLWERHGDSIPLARILAISALPRETQPAAWNAAADHSGGHRRGKEKKPGPAKLRKMLASANRGRSPEWIDGATTALRAALGEESWPLMLGSLD